MSQHKLISFSSVLFFIKALQKAFTLEDDVSPSGMEGDHPQTSPNLSESSDSDVTSRLPRHSKHNRTRSLTPSPATQPHLGQTHMRGEIVFT